MRHGRIFGTLLSVIMTWSPGSTALAAPADMSSARIDAERKLHQSFANLHFEDLAPSPIRGPVYQANAGGRILYYAPESGHLIFAAVYDKDGVNLTALAQDNAIARHLAMIDPAKALAIGPPGAPTVIEFTDPECPYSARSRNSGTPRRRKANRSGSWSIS